MFVHKNPYTTTQVQVSYIHFPPSLAIHVTNTTRPWTRLESTCPIYLYSMFQPRYLSMWLIQGDPEQDWKVPTHVTYIPSSPINNTYIPSSPTHFTYETTNKYDINLVERWRPPGDTSRKHLNNYTMNSVRATLLPISNEISVCYK